MLDALLIPVAVLYLLVVGTLFAYGVNFFYLTGLSIKTRHARNPVPEVEEWPSVTVQLPIYNELYVARRLLLAAASLDYPQDRLEIQVLDDSTDETTQVVAQTLAEIEAEGNRLRITHLRRADRQGYKAGALAYGMTQSDSELFAIFDADFIPPENYLRRTVPQFQDARIGFVQTRWGHVNRSFSLLTYLQSLAIDAHFMVEQFARSQGGFLFNFNGTAGVWRREAIETAGGWRADTLTEDLDLSYRAFLNGWQAKYLREVEVPAELPISFSAYRRQQYRWARGSFECALELVPRVWSAPLSFRQKVQASLHLTGYGVHLLLFALGLLYPLILLLSSGYANLISLFGIAAVFNITAFAPTAFFLVAQRQLGQRWWRQLPLILVITALGAGMMLNTLRAALQLLRGGQARFERTPKFGLARRGQPWSNRRYQLRLDPLVAFELAFAAFNLFTAVYAFQLGNWVIGVYASLFTLGLLFTSGVSILQAFQIHKARPSVRFQ